jgi:hypothetical protein
MDKPYLNGIHTSKIINNKAFMCRFFSRVFDQKTFAARFYTIFLSCNKLTVNKSK